MVELEVKNKVDEVHSLYREWDEVKQRYDKAREELLNILVEHDMNKVYFQGGYVTIVTRPKDLNFGLLQEKYPEIYYKGMTTQFNYKEANKYFPRNILKVALEECSEGVSEYVKIQVEDR